MTLKFTLIFTPTVYGGTIPVDNDSDTDPDPDLAADEPPLSESSEDEAPAFVRSETKDSGFNPVSDDSRSQQSARTTPPPRVSPPRQGTSNQEFNSPESEQEFSTPPQTIVRPRGRPKGSKNIKRVYFDAEAIGLRTRAKLHKGEYDEDGDYLMPICDDAVNFSCNINTNERGHYKIGLDTFINECQLQACEYSNNNKSQQSDKPNYRGTTSNGKNPANLDCHCNNSLINNRHHTGNFVGN